MVCAKRGVIYMAVKICHASISENGNAGWDGKATAGDSTGKEVCVRDWYNKPWNVVLRCNDSNLAKRAAEIAVKLANSNLVGYDQSERNTLYRQLKGNSFSAESYIRSGKKTETDCSAFIYACYACVMPSIRSDANAPTTSTMRSFFKKYGFSVYTDGSYAQNSSKLMVGDIILKEGSHVAIVCESSLSTPAASSSAGNSGIPSNLNKTKRKYRARVTASALNVRTGPGVNYSECTFSPLKKGAIVGVYDTVGSWSYIRRKVGKSYKFGFCSSQYLKKTIL